MIMFPLRGANDRPPVWVFDPHPGSVHCVILVGPDEFDLILERGYASLDGRRAIPVRDQCVRELGWIRLLLAEPYQIPPDEGCHSSAGEPMLVA